MTKLESLKKNSHFETVLRNRVVNNDLFSIYCVKNFIKKKNNTRKLYISAINSDYTYIVFGKPKAYGEHSKELFERMKKSFKGIKA